MESRVGISYLRLACIGSSTKEREFQNQRISWRSERLCDRTSSVGGSKMAAIILQITRKFMSVVHRLFVNILQDVEVNDPMHV